MKCLKICKVLISPIINSYLTSYDSWNLNYTFCLESDQGPMELTLKNYTKATRSCLGNAGLGRSAPIDRNTYLSSLGTSERKQALKMSIFQIPGSNSR